MWIQHHHNDIAYLWKVAANVNEFEIHSQFIKIRHKSDK